MKRAFKRITPQPIWHFIRDTYDAVRRIPELPAAYLHPWRRESNKRLTDLKNIHKGKRAFIVGNGPSLKQTDLSRLKNEITFGMNRIYLAFPEWGFTTTYLCVTNDLVVEQFVEDINTLTIPKFVAWRSHRHFKQGMLLKDIPTFTYTSYTGPRFATDARGRIWEGATVTNLALQLAYHMGIEKAILIGVDHNFKDKGEANKTVVSEGDDQNHFMPNYFGKGVKWQLPDLDTSEIGYMFAREAFLKAGREVVDAT
ncbi:MAG TPA: 6-hydroxymethylpterin diphosphokinase MptE-like protein, partial [Anaerolineales bacterium]|nr:6-hydroxymethylpterin diphosphokinase MptE-like protein [Anaerolineales bacterium]